MEEFVLEVNGLSKNYGKLKAVDNLSFKLERGEVYGILGPNGSGKTTTLAMLINVVLPSSGSFSWLGNGAGKNIRRKIGSMLEKPNFYEYLSAVDNLKIVAEIRGVDYSEIDKVLSQVGLLERKNSKFKTYSLGMKQRLAIGAALLGNPEVLILDEPTNGLDPEGIAEVRRLIKNLASDNKTIILASHLLDEVQKVCTKMLVLKKGVKIFQGSVNGLEKDKVIIEVMADDMELLEAILSKSTDFNKFKRNNNIIQIEVDTNINKSALSTYLFENKIIVSHLAVKQESLEENIFELLKETK